MTDLKSTLRQVIEYIGRPRAEFRIVDVDAFDTRLKTLERRQREIAARLRLLEIQSDPFGLDNDAR